MSQPHVFTGVFFLFSLLLSVRCFIPTSKAENLPELNIGNMIQQLSSSHQNQPSIILAQRTIKNIQKVQKELFTSNLGQNQFNSHSQIWENSADRTVSQNPQGRTVYSKFKPLEQKVSQANVITPAGGNQKSNTIILDQNPINKIPNTSANQANLTQNKTPSTTTTPKNPNNPQISSSNTASGNSMKNNNNSDVGKNNIAESKPAQNEIPKNNQSPNNKNLTNSPSSPNKSPTFQELANNLFSDSFSNNFFNTNDQAKKIFDNFFNDSSTKSAFNTDNFFTNPFSSNFNPTKKQIVNKQFAGIGFYHDIPLSFMTGEVFKFSGIILNPSTIMSSGPYKYNFINIVFTEWGTKEQFRCVEEVSVKDLEFQISCKMQKAGRYFLSIFPGQTGQSSIRIRSIRDTSVFMSSVLAFNLKSNYAPVNLSCDVVDNKLEIRWGTIAPLTNLTVTQPQKNGEVIKKQFLLSNYHQKFQLPFEQFSDFQPTTTHVEICHADSDDGTLYEISTSFSKQNAKYTFQAVKHRFDEENFDLATISPPIPWRINVGDKIKFNATFKESIRNEVYLILPNGGTAKVNFTKSLPANATVRAGTPLDLDITFTGPGTYILEINAASGIAIINRPIYVGEGLPLIPDHKDLIEPTLAKEDITAPKKALEAYVAKKHNSTQTKKEPDANASISEKRDYLLLLLNNLRKTHQVDPVILDDQLNTIAQYHSDDMNKNEYFSHTSLNGDGPGQRAKRFNFNNSIGQNIAQSNSLTQAHLNLERSAVHLQNSIKKEWKRVGIGISRSRIGQYYVTFEFSSRDLIKQPLTKDELEKISGDMLKLIFDRNPNIKKQNKKLSGDVRDWMDSPRSTGVFPYLQSKKYQGSMSATSFSISYSSDVIDRLDKTRYLEGFYRFQEVGLGLKMLKNQPDMLEGYAVFA